MSDSFEIRPVAYIRTPFPSKFGIPRQSGILDEIEGKIVFEKEFRDINAFRELENFSHIWLIWGFSHNEGKAWSPSVRPPKLGGNKRVGVFASRAPFRPNPLGLSCVKLEEVILNSPEGPVLRVFGADLVDNTPIYDIKPYIAYSDSRPDAQCGFSVDAEEAKIPVEFDEASIRDVPPRTVETIRDILAQDPRPSYKNEGDRIYALEFAEFEIFFVYQNKKIMVKNITRR